MGEHAAAAALVEADGRERCGRRQIDAVERGQPAVEVHLVGGEQAAEVAAPPGDVVEHDLQARPQVGRDLRGELRVAGRILHDLGAEIDPQPREEEVANLGSREAIRHHPLGMRAHALGAVQFSRPCRRQERLVGDRIPEPEREPGGRGEAVRRGRRLAEQEPR